MLRPQVVPDEMAKVLRDLRAERSWRLNPTLLLANQNGWKRQALARAMGLVRQAVTARLAYHNSGTYGAIEFPPPPPPPEPPPPKPRSQSTPVPEHVAEELRRMYAIARTVRGCTPLNHSSRTVSAELSQWLWDLNRNQGMSYANLAKAMGCEVITVRRRFERYAYKNRPPSVKPYRGIYYVGHGGANKKDTCHRGHPMIDGHPNVGLRKARSDRKGSVERYCKACLVINNKAWRERKKEAATDAAKDKLPT